MLNSNYEESFKHQILDKTKADTEMSGVIDINQFVNKNRPYT